MLIDSHKVAYLLGAFQYAYQHDLSEVIETILKCSKRGIGAITSEENSRQYEKLFVKDRTCARLLKMFTPGLERLALRSKNGQGELADQYVVSVGPQHGGGFVAKIEVNQYELTKTKKPLLVVTIPNENQKPWRICMPLVMVMKKFTLDTEKYSGYGHGISQGLGRLPLSYAGITKRNWLTRYAEHFSEAERGSKKRFHQHWLNAFYDSATLSYSELVVVNMSYDEIMEWEEQMVDMLFAEYRALNMIPGGRKGVLFLHEHRLLHDNKAPSLDDIDRATHEFLQSDIPSTNPLVRALWKDPDYAAKVICGGKNRLSIQQLTLIRQLALYDVDTELITAKVDARTKVQVQNVIDGKTYTRVKTPQSSAVKQRFN